MSKKRIVPVKKFDAVFLRAVYSFDTLFPRSTKQPFVKKELNYKELVLLFFPLSAELIDFYISINQLITTISISFITNKGRQILLNK